MTETARITTDPGIMGGKPVIRGLRIEASQVASMAQSMSITELLAEYPYLEGADAIAALRADPDCSMQVLIGAAAQVGPHPVEGVEIYWDAQDPANEGPAYRIGEPGSGEQESGELEFVGWSRADHHYDDDTYGLCEYFDGDGAYLGPDQHGVHPTFRVA